MPHHHLRFVGFIIQWSLLGQNKNICFLNRSNALYLCLITTSCKTTVHRDIMIAVFELYNPLFQFPSLIIIRPYLSFSDSFLELFIRASSCSRKLEAVFCCCLSPSVSLDSSRDPSHMWPLLFPLSTLASELIVPLSSFIPLSSVPDSSSENSESSM